MQLCFVSIRSKNNYNFLCDIEISEAQQFKKAVINMFCDYVWCVFLRFLIDFSHGLLAELWDRGCVCFHQGCNQSQPDLKTPVSAFAKCLYQNKRK